VLLWLLAALGLGALASLLPGWITLRRETDSSAIAPMQQDRFDIACGSDVDEARTVLARWWDPHAPPASSRH
jgi:hypothetical protein